MIRKIYVFLLILSFHPFCKGQVIAPQPVNDSICSGQQEATFNLVSVIPDVNFFWETGPSQAGPWSPVSSPDITGVYNDTLKIFNAAAYAGSWFRCRLYNRFTDSWIEDSNPIKIVIIQPPVPDFGIAQLSVQSDCYSFCPDTYVSFIDLTADDYAITEWLWDFGDGEISVFPGPNHLFPVMATQQQYTVSLTAWNAYGCSATTQKTVTVLPEKILTVNGPEVVCSNQASDELSLYYSVSPYDETCVYEWILPPAEYVLETEQIDGGTIRIHWKTISAAAQISLGVIEKSTACDRVCVTGEGNNRTLQKKSCSKTATKAYWCTSVLTWLNIAGGTQRRTITLKRWSPDGASTSVISAKTGTPTNMNIGWKPP
jgi:PKD repeat protein